MAEFHFEKLVIVGVGLIGGSLACALRRGGARGRIVGVGRTTAAVQRALELGVIDAGAGLDDAALPALLAGADLVLLATPVAQIGPVLTRIAPHLPVDAVLTDAGSTKVEPVAAARAALGARFTRFVPAHPIAGGERSGVDAAVPDLFEGCNVMLCPLPETRPEAIMRVAGMWRAAGARIREMPPERHDRVFSAVSHLPHLLAFAFLDMLLDSDDRELKFDLAGGGFRDFTRIAASNPEMWRDICLSNRRALLADIDAFAAVLEHVRAAIDAGDGAALDPLFDRARTARAGWGRTYAPNGGGK